MKKISLLAMFLVAASTGTPTTAQEEAPVKSEVQLETTKDKISYSTGAQLGSFLEYGKDLIDLDIMVKAIQDIFEQRQLAMHGEEIDALFQGFQTQVAQNRQTAMESEGKLYLDAKADEEGVEVLPSGLQYKIVTAGTGASPAAESTVKVHYAGRLIGGEEFDSSYSRGEPIEFPVTGVIPGWTEALQLMKVGAKWELYIPYNLAYGPQGKPPVIPPFATLVFDVELLDIVK